MRHRTPNVVTGNGADRREIQPVNSGDAVWLVIGILIGALIGVLVATNMGVMQ